MENSEAFNEELDTALKECLRHLNGKVIPELKDNVRGFQTSYKGFYNLLLQKSFINDDPYKGDSKIADIKLPPQGPVAESDKRDAVSVRLSEYDSLLDYMATYYDFNINFISIEKIKKIVSFIRYVDWNSLNAGSSNVTTMLVAEVFQNVKSGGDDLTVKLATDGINQLKRYSQSIQKNLQEMASYYREDYKYNIRTSVLAGTSLDPEMVKGDPEGTINSLKRKFKEVMGDQAFYSPLIKEVLFEDYYPEGAKRREEVLKRLRPQKSASKEAAKKNSGKEDLLNAVRIMGSMAGPFQKIETKLNFNLSLLENRKKSLTEKLRRFFFGEKKEKRIFVLEMIDEETSAARSVKLDFNEFMETLQRLYRVCGAVGNKMSNTYNRLSSSSEDKIYDFLSRQIADIAEAMKKLPALDEYFKETAPLEYASQIKGIKLDINDLKSSVIKVNKRRVEYVSRKEEEEQLKKLGVKDV